MLPPSGVFLEPGTWAHIALSYDGYTLELYKDGIHVAETDQLAGTTFTGSPLLLADPSSNESFYIGQNSEWGEYFTGAIDDVRIYSRALTEEEIQQAMETMGSSE